MKIEWLESYKLGVPEVDDLRQKLFVLTNEFLASDDLMVLRPVIVALYKQARAQFELEEALMQRANYPDLPAHAEQHRQLLDHLMSRSMDVGKGHMNKPAIAALMKHWASQHVPHEDAAVAAFLAG